MQKATFILTGILALTLFAPSAAWALDEDSDVFDFIPSDAPQVAALDIDEFLSYARSVGENWRDADKAHFTEALQIFSDILAEKEGKPDVLTFFGHLSGVVAISMDTDGGMPLMAFEAQSGNQNVLANYTIAYIAEKHYRSALDEIQEALRSYYSRTVEDPDDPDETISPHNYPASLDILIEEGYLDEMPINPYTGQPMQFLDSVEDESLGDVAYIPSSSSRMCCGGPCGEEEGSCSEEDPYITYKLVSFLISGVLSQGPYRYYQDYKPYPDLADRLSLIESLDPEDMGFETEQSGAWTFYNREGSCYAFASSDIFLLFGANVDELEEAVARQRSGNGYHFNPPADFDTAGAFYRDEADLSNLGECVKSALPEEIPMDCAGIMEGMMAGLGIEALSMQHTACWLRDGDIESVRRMELTGEGQRTLVGSLLYAEPKELMTAQGGPFDIIAELAWANPGEYAQGLMDFALEFVMPMVADQTGMEEMDPDMMLGMVGLGELDPSTVEEAYVLLTCSEDRGGGLYLPGMIVAKKVGSPDVGPIAVGLVDSISFMVGFPLGMSDFDDENAATWVTDEPKCPISPTIAWTDDWLVASLFREDALAARDALENGTLFSPDGLDPANSRLQVNRQRLMRGAADVLYAIPSDDYVPVAAGGMLFELAAQLSESDERLYFETVSNGEYIESRSIFSLGLIEDLVPVFAYLVKAIDTWD